MIDPLVHIIKQIVISGTDLAAFEGGSVQIYGNKAEDGDDEGAASAEGRQHRQMSSVTERLLSELPEGIAMTWLLPAGHLLCAP
jgi:hypothetical protein